MSNKYIVIEKPTVSDANKVIWPIQIDGKRDEIIITVSDNVAQYLTVDRIDAIVSGLLIFAARNGYDFKSELPITDELMYGLTHHLIPAISSKVHTLVIDAPVTEVFESEGEIVATGISCGVDSLYTVATHTHLPNSKDNITHLAFFDAGSHHSDKGPSLTKEGRRELAKKFAADNGFKYFEVTSSVPEFIARHNSQGYSHVENHTFTMLQCVFSIAKGIRCYYYSAGLTYNGFKCTLSPDYILDAANYDLLTLMAASFGPIRFFSAGGEVRRFDKLELLTDYEPAHNSLNVCIEAIENDNTCFKCVRTLLELDALGALDRFNSVFDINYYRQHRTWYLEQAYIGALKGDLFMKELLPYFKKDLSLWFKLHALAKKTVSVIKNRL